MAGQEAATGKHGAGGEFAKQVTHWMMPNCPNGGRSVSADVVANKGMTDKGKRTVGLESQVRHAWATPRATDGTKGGPNQIGSKGDPILAGQVCQWPTPAQRDGDARRGPTHPDSDAWKNKVARGAVNATGMLSDDLSSSAAHWPTPAARDHKGTNSSQHMTRTDGRTDGRSRNHADQLPNFVMFYFSHQDPTMNDGPQSSSSTPNSPQRLNPLFAAWLMGWPSTWAIAEPHVSSAQETALWRSRLRQHLSSLLDAQDLRRKAA